MDETEAGRAPEDDQGIDPRRAMRWKHDKKAMPCRTCGEPMMVGVRTRKSPQHLECSLHNMSEAMRQMQNKSGPYYEKWLERRWQKGDPRYGATPRAQRMNGGASKT